MTATETRTPGQMADAAFAAVISGDPFADTLTWFAADAYAKTQGYDSAGALYAAEGLTCLGRPASTHSEQRHAAHERTE